MENHSAYGNAHHRRQRSQEEVLPPLPDEQDSEWESDDFQITMPNSLTEASSRPSRIPALRALNDQEEPVARNVIVSFCFEIERSPSPALMFIA